MFLEKRVYQGSSGKVYPLPFTDRIAEQPAPRSWKAVWIENEFLRALVLPELGGRIHALQDKTTGYDLIYSQHVIKPALVGLAGPWISGGIEFNWPQHHRPATFLPADVEIEEHADGSKTIWCGDHDPLCRMKGMHGVCLHPGQARLELKVRAFNRTPFVQTFLWWANVATRVHEAYQSFFPPDVYYVADHARRSMSEYPLAKAFYYGVNYGERGRQGIPVGEVPRQFVPPHCPTTGEKSKQETCRVSIGQTTTPPVGIPKYAPNDLSFYANIPVPTSYMCMGSSEDFFGGYDYAAQAGIVHVANHHLSPGKKQWTWGNQEFGYAWDRNLTDPDAKGEFGPYIEIMAGVYTDNQPDFSFLQPGETKTWSQYWYPIQQIGPVQQANLDAAVALNLAHDVFEIGICATRVIENASVRLEPVDGSAIAEWRARLAPGKPFVLSSRQPRSPWKPGTTVLRVLDGQGREIIAYRPKPRVRGKVPPPATEPPLPEAITTADELYITGLHLEQYRHATRSPADYWREALRRDPADARCNNAMGLWHLRRGEFALAENHFRKAIARLTRRNANPYDGEPYYNLGLCLRYHGEQREAEAKPTGGQDGPAAAMRPREERRGNLEPRALASPLAEAYAVFYKATWNQAWAAAAYHALAELDCLQACWHSALDHLDRSLRLNTDNLRALDLKALVLRKLGRVDEAASVLRQTRQLDPLDWWARHIAGEHLGCDLQVCLDLAHDYARAGFFDEAIQALQQSAARYCPGVGNRKFASGNRYEARPQRANGEQRFETGSSRIGDLPDQSWGAMPLVAYTLGWLELKRGNRAAARDYFKTASGLPADYCFPARLEEIAILQAAINANPRDARALYYLGNLLYDRRRHEEAIRLWERSAKVEPAFSIVWRNLGIGYFNVRRRPALARAAYERAFGANPADPRLLFERDQLWKRLRVKPGVRLRELEKHLGLVEQRDDVTIELCALCNQTGRAEKALAVLSSRKFQPWEGGEGAPLAQHVRAHLALGRQALRQGSGPSAVAHFQAALTAPLNLGEARHLLANQSDAHYWLGCALAALGERQAARQHWRTAATFKGDFQQMSVRTFSEMTYYSALAWERLGQKARARKLLRDLLAYGRKLQIHRARIDYFATSLPTLLLFDDDLQFRQETTALFLQAQALLGLGQRAAAKKLCQRVLKRDPNHGLAADLVTE